MLVIGGELDNPEIWRAAGVLADGIPGAQKAIIYNGAPLPNLEKQAELRQAVRDFLQSARESLVGRLEDKHLEDKHLAGKRLADKRLADKRLADKHWRELRSHGRAKRYFITDQRRM